MTYAETCPSCKHSWEGEFPTWISHTEDVYHFACQACNHYFDVENNPKIVWKLDPYSKTWYTTLVHKYTKLDESTRKFEYYD